MVFMKSPSDEFMEDLRKRVQERGFDSESLAREAGVSDTNVVALLHGFWNPHIGKAVCEVLGIANPPEGLTQSPPDA